MYVIIIGNEIINTKNKIFSSLLAPEDSDENKLSAEILQQQNISDVVLAVLNKMEAFCATSAGKKF